MFQPTTLDLGMLSQIIQNSTDSGHSSSNSSISDRLSPFSGNSTLLDVEQCNFSAVVRKPNIFSLPSPHRFESHSRKTSESSSLSSSAFEELAPCDLHNLNKDLFCYDCIDEVCVECVKQRHTQHYLYPGITSRELFEQTEKAHALIRDNISIIMKQVEGLQNRRTNSCFMVKKFFNSYREALDMREAELIGEINLIFENKMRTLEQKLKENEEAMSYSKKMMDHLTKSLRIGDVDEFSKNSRYAKKHLETLRSMNKNLVYTVDEEIHFQAPGDDCLEKVKEMGRIRATNYPASAKCAKKAYTNYGYNMASSYFENGASAFGHSPSAFSPSAFGASSFGSSTQSAFGQSPSAFSPSSFNAYQPFGPSLANSPLTPVAQLSSVSSALGTPESYNLPMLPFIGNPISNEIVPTSPLAAMPAADAMGMFPVSFHTRRAYSRIKKPVTVFGKEGAGEYELCRPWGVCCDNNGHIIIADRSNNRIQIFRSDGSHVRSFGRQGTEEGEFNRPAGVAIDYYGRIVVTDKDNHRIQVFTMEGKFVFAFGERGQTNGKFHYPWDVDVNSAGLIAVTDTRNHRVQIFTGNGMFLKKFGFESVSTMWKFFDSPRGICFTLENTLMVTDFNNHRLYEIDIENQPKLLHSENYKKCELFRPQGLAMDSDGNILVADCRNNRIQVFSRRGEVIGSFGSAGKEVGQFDRPSGIALTPDGKIVIVDFGNHRIQIF